MGAGRIQPKAHGKIAIVANAQYMWHVLRMPMEFFSQRMAGDIASRKERNASIAGDLISEFAPLAIQTFMMIFYLCVMLRYSWPTDFGRTGFGRDKHTGVAVRVKQAP